MSDPEQTADSKIEKPPAEPRSSRVRTGLLVLGSALFGGIAVVLWNRRTLTNMQNQSQDKVQKPLPVDEGAIY
jgi:hypothetical protein